MGNRFPQVGDLLSDRREGQSQGEEKCADPGELPIALTDNCVFRIQIHVRQTITAEYSRENFSALLKSFWLR
jgi:hypothetical protein